MAVAKKKTEEEVKEVVKFFSPELNETYVKENYDELVDLKRAATKLRSGYGMSTPAPVFPIALLLQMNKMQKALDRLVEIVESK